MRKNNIGTRSLKGKRFVNLRRRVLSAAIIAASQTAWVTPAIAGPDGGHVVGGDGSIGRDGRNTTIHQRSDRMAIDWDSYNVAADEVVTYVQPGRDAVALNRILSHSGSEIHGQINANGQVVLVNPHGVFFGENAQVNVGGLIASGMTVDVSDFMNGDFTFSAVDGAEGKVINQGLINAATGGSVTLLGKQVRNDGLISARLGAVNLAAGKEAVVTFDEAGLMGVRVSKEILQDELGVDAAVLNTGEITASGGRILLSGSTSQDIFSQAVNRGDLQQATSAVVHEDGSFTLGAGADVVNTGTLNVSSADRGAGDIVVLGENVTQAGTVLASTQSGTSGSIELHAAHTALLTDESLTAARAEGRGQGGQIKVLGHHVGLTDQAMVDASGAWGGGQVYIGGDYQGDNPFMPNAWRSFVGDQARINANALADGDGGRIIVWADDITRFFGSIEGKGAGENGTGGFAEVSGKNLLRFDGLADMRGPGGVGTLLLDPRDIIITWEVGDNVGPEVSFDDGEVDQDLHIGYGTLESNLHTANVKLEATRNITIETDSHVNADSSNSLTLLAGKDIVIRSNLNLGQGDLSLTAGVFSCGEVDCYSGDEARSVEIDGVLNTRGTIDIRAADNITLNDNVGTTASHPSSVSFRAGNDITIEGGSHINVSAAPDATAISLIAGDTSLASEEITVAPAPGGEGNLIIGGNLNSNGTDYTRGGNIVLNAAGELQLNADVIAQGGDVTASADAITFGHNGKISTRLGGGHGAGDWSIGGNVWLNAGTSIDLGDIVTHDCADMAACNGGNLTLSGLETGHPNIDQRDSSSLDIAGTTTINIGAGTATLNNNANRFLGAVSGSANNLEISGGGDGLTFGDLNITSNLTATASGDITDLEGGDSEHIIRVDGLASFNTNGNSLLLANREHQLSTVEMLGEVREVELKNGQNLDVGAITTIGDGGKVDIDVAGNLTVSGAISTRGVDGGGYGQPGDMGGAISLASSGTLTVGELNASGGGRAWSAHGHDGAPIELTGAEVILLGDISSRGSEGYGSNHHGTSGNITITGNTVIDPSGKDTIIVDNTGSGDPETHSGVFKLDGTLNGVYRPGDDEPDEDGSGDDPAEVCLFTNLTINSSDVTLEGSIGNSTALGNLTINTYGDVDFGSQSFPNASSIQVTGLAGDNTLRAPDVAGEWRITASGGGRLSAASGGTTSIEFSNMSTLVGSSFSDRFTIATGDDIDLSIIGNRDDDASNGTATNTLVGADRENHWSITSAGGGMLNEKVQFQGIDSLVGGTNLDQFVLSGWGSVSQIDGGELGVHGPNTVQLEEGVNRSFSIGLGAPDTDIQLVNIGNVRASASDGHVLIGANQTNKWLIDDENAGKLNDQVDFTGFTFLRGNGADDTFVIVGDGVITGNIDGGDEGDNTLDLSGVTTDRALTIALREATNADFTLQNITAINSQAGAEHTLVADHQTNTWSITGTNTGEVAGVLFNGMANLVGGQLDDTFVFTAAGDITGLINGGGHETENTLDYSRVPGIDIALGDDNDFINIQHLIGDNNNSTLRAADQNNEWLLTGGVNAGTLNDDLRFTGITNLVGGAEHDVFTVNGGTLTGSIKAGKGSSSLYLTIGSGANGRLRFLGGEGNDQVEINGGGENYQAHYTIDGAGQESLSYITGANGTSYDLLYQGVAEVQDNVYADKLTLQASSPTDEMVLGGNRFHAPGYSELHFNNKHNLTLAASSQNHIKLDGLIDIPGTFEVQNALVTQSNDQARIEARHLILTSIAGFGTEDQPVHTRVERANIRLGRADLYLRNHGDLSLNELTGSGTVSIQSEGMLNSAADLSLSGFASFVSHQGDITLAGDNLLSGEISLAAAGNITLRNQNDSRLQRVQADNFTLTSKGDITAPGVLTVNGLTTLRADGDITLLNDNNQLNELDVQQAQNVTVHAGHWLDLGHVYSSGDVYTRTQGLSLSDRLTANSFRFDAGQGASVIDGQLNVSTLTGKAQGITVRQAISVDQMELDSRGGTMELNAELETLQNLTLRGTNIEQNAALFSGAELRVSSDANYRQRANIASAEDLWITASGDITMESGALSHTHSGQIRYQAGNDIALSSLDASGSTVSLTADRGSISNNNGSDINVFADRLEMSAGAGIGRAAALTTDIRVLDAQSQSGRLAVVNQGELQVDRMASNGNVRLSNRTGDIYLNNQDGPVFNTAESDARLAGGTLNGNYNLGTVVVEVADGSLYGLGQAHAHKPDLVGREVIMLAPNGTVGSRGRPLVVYAKDLSSTIAGHTWPMWWAFDVRPSQVENDSGIPQELLDFASAGSHQMVEVESLEDINPAIFTEVRNYTYSNVSVLLPPDQRYDDEGDQ